MEAIAIIGCIAAVVSAYKDGGILVDKIKQRRLAKQAPPPTRLLEESLARGPQAVEEAKTNGIDRFGNRYAAGDKIALDSLKDILIDLQGSLIKHLMRAQEDDNMADFTTLVDASDIGRIKTVTVLNDLYMRVAVESTIARDSFGDIRTFTGLPVSCQNHPALTQFPSDAPLPPTPKVVDSNMGLQSIPMSSNPERQQDYSASPPDQKSGRRTTPKSGFFDRFRRKSSTEDKYSRKSSSLSSASQSGADITPTTPTTPPGSQQPKTSSPSMTSPQAAIDEENPWMTENGAHDAMTRQPQWDPSMSRAPTLVPGSIIRPRSSTMGSSSLISRERALSSSALPGGFCKGAYKLQEHAKGAMELRNKSWSLLAASDQAQTIGQGYYWACSSSKCAFEGPAQHNETEWTYDDTVRESHGVRYRWSFLAKAHVMMTKAKNGKYDYGCVFCVYDGIECPALHGIKEFLAHVRTHRGKPVPEIVSQRIACIHDRVAGLDEAFDVNLRPLEIKQDQPAESRGGTSIVSSRYASSSTMGGDMANPQSASKEQAEVKSSRTMDSQSSPDTASVQTPVSDRSKIPGDQDEGTGSQEAVKQDPSKPAEEKRKSVESQGKKPLGPEDHQ
ncbi:MAG: hypothetical protein Q9174_004315 [Haloplaca sp. 1 TL-2023]